MPLKNTKTITELSRATPDAAIISRDSETYKRVYDLLETHTFIWIVDAWKKLRDPGAISWSTINNGPIHEPLGYGSVEACQKACDEMEAGLKLLEVCGQACVVRNEVIQELKQVLRREAKEKDAIPCH